MMKPEWWRKVEELFYAALECESDRRAAFLDQSCAGDEWLRNEVESLLKAHEQSSAFIRNPILVEAVQSLTAKPGASVVGLQLDHYQLLDLLGAGGMGEVYLAQDLKLNRKAALKLLPSLFTTDEERVRRLRREARAISALNHPNILTIYEIGEAGATHYLATEYIDGATLRQRMAGGRLKIDEALEVAEQVASALAAAHAAGIVHRDIKPENIMVRRDGYIKVVDFGLARHTELQELAAPEVSSTYAAGVGSGGVIGTVKYMSPEQAQGRAVDGRSDIWSLGVVLYEMLTGQAPFDGPTAGDTVLSILEDEPQPLAGFVRETSVELQRIVTRALSKRSEERYQTAQELLVDLRQLRQGMELSRRLGHGGLPRLHEATPGRGAERQAAQHASTSAPRGARPKRSRAILKAARRGVQSRRAGPALLITAVILALLVSGRSWMDGLGGQPSRSVEVAKMRRLTTTGNAVAAAISPDGMYFVYVTEDAGRQSLRGRQLSGGPEAERQLLPPRAVTYVGLSFSPDGEYIYYVVREGDGPEGTLYRMPARGGASRNLQVGDIETPVTFSPDGGRIAFISRDPDGEQVLKLASADGTNVRSLAARRYPNFFMNPAWSPDGETVACVAGSYLRGFFMTVVNVRVSDGVEQTLTSRTWWSVRRLVWQSDGRGLFLVVMDKAAGMPSYIAHLAYPGGEVQKITNDLDDYRELSMTTGSKALVAVQSLQTSDLYVAPVGEGDRAIPITHTKYDQIAGIAWTPDGKIVHALRRAGEDWDIWSLNADGTGRVRLTGATGNNLDPSVSSDGRYVVFDSTRSGATNIWRADSDGGNARRLTSGPGEWWPSVSPDGRSVVYTSFAGAQPTLWNVPIDGGAPVQLTDRFSMLPAVSPSGALIACYLRDGGSAFELKMAVLTPDGRLAAAFAAPDGKFQPLQWTSDGQALAYVQDRDGVSNVWSQPIAGGPPQQLTDFTTEHIFSFAVSHDGKRIALARGSVTSDVVLIELR